VEETRELQRWLAALTPEQRAVVELRLAGLSGAEMAAALGCSLGAVKIAATAGHRPVAGGVAGGANRERRRRMARAEDELRRAAQ